MLEQQFFFLFYFVKKEHDIELTDHFSKHSLENSQVQNVIHQQQSAGPITQRSEDQNLALLAILLLIKGMSQDV